MQFHEITIEDRKLMLPYLAIKNYRTSDTAFGTGFGWRHYFKAKVAFHGDFMVTKSGKEPEKAAYAMPRGNGNLKQMLLDCIEDAKENNTIFHMIAITDEMRQELDAALPGRFSYEENRDFADYIYDVQSLSTLAGKKLHSKRNHINKFLSQYSFIYEEIDEGNMAECLDLSKTWLLHNTPDINSSLCAEQKVIEEYFKYYRELEMRGGALRINGKLIAFTIGEKLSKDTFITHVEKALGEYNGAYTMINQQFALHALQDFKYVNREEDMGIEGLRKAKLSYFPEILLNKYIVTLAD